MNGNPASLTSRLLATFLNPYVQLAIDAILVSAAELLLKKGAVTATPLIPKIAWLGVGALASKWTWLGIIAYVLSFGCWLCVLRSIPVSIAFGLISIAQVLVPLGAWAFLGEAVSHQRWIGIASVLCGTALIAQTIVAKRQT
jgi:multidrug transporter EmrE-like cation transporter